MTVTKVLHMLWACDMDWAIGFYGDVMGLAVKSQSPHWSELTLGDSTVALHIGSNEKSKNTGLSFEVDDIAAACNEIAATGGSVLNPPRDGDIPGLRLAHVADPDGNRMQLGHHEG